MRKIRIAYAEDFSLEREAIVRLLSAYEDLEFVYTCGNGIELLAWLDGQAPHNLPDVVLLDINMKLMGGRETFHRIRKKFRDQRIVMLTEHFEDKYIREYFDKGVNGFLSKNSKADTIAETLRKVYMGGLCIDPLLHNILARSVKKKRVPEITFTPNRHGMTAHRIGTLKGMLQGKKTQQIADDIGLSYKAIEHLRAEVWRLTRCQKNNYPQLMEFAFRNGIVSF